MLNRRHIRLKIMQIIYALEISKFNYDNDVNKQLFKSLEDIYDLYLVLISLLIEVQIRAESFLKISQKKHLATTDDINPNKKFINNRMILLLRSNKLIEGELKKRKLNYMRCMVQQKLELLLVYQHLIQKKKALWVRFCKTVM